MRGLERRGEGSRDFWWGSLGRRAEPEPGRSLRLKSRQLPVLPHPTAPQSAFQDKADSGLNLILKSEILLRMDL